MTSVPALHTPAIGALLLELLARDREVTRPRGHMRRRVPLVAACVGYGGGLVATGDEGNIQRLAAAVPSVRVVTRRAR